MKAETAKRHGCDRTSASAVAQTGVEYARLWRQLYPAEIQNEDRQWDVTILYLVLQAWSYSRDAEL